MVILMIIIDKETGASISNPDIISRGFIYVRESEDLISEMKDITKQVLTEYQGKDWSTIKGNVKKSLADYLYTKTKRKPMILPIIIEI